MTILRSISFCALTRFVEIASTSSMNNTHGAIAAACSKISRILCSDSPETPAINSVATICINGTSSCWKFGEKMFN